MHNDAHHPVHSAHEMMTTGHKAIEQIVTRKVVRILEEKHADKLDELAKHIAEGVCAHIEALDLSK